MNKQLNSLNFTGFRLLRFTLELPAVKSVSMKMADELLNEKFTDLSNMVEDYEKIGAEHVYFLSDGSEIRINKRYGVRLMLANTNEYFGMVQLATFKKTNSV